MLAESLPVTVAYNLQGRYFSGWFVFGAQEAGSSDDRPSAP
jgi:hypothetical protein